MQSFEDKVGFVTGGASGIGLGITKKLVEAGMKVVIADLRQESAAYQIESVTPVSR